MRLTDLELLAKLQHYGAATCLIDFTKLPLVALWMACQPPKIKDNRKSILNPQKLGRVIMFDGDDSDICAEVSIHEANDINKRINTWLNKEEKLWIYTPKKQYNRIVAQNSVFVFGKRLIPNNVYSSCFITNKKEILDELKKQGISEEWLFCDFIGFALNNAPNIKHGNWTGNYFISGLMCQEDGNFEKAVSFYDKEIKNNPRSSFAYNNRGAAKVKLGEYKSAIKDYSKAIQIDQNYAKAYNNRGNVKADLGDHQDAIDDYSQAIKFNQNYAEAYYNRGIAKDELGDKTGAKADFEEAYKLDPECKIPDRFKDKGGKGGV